MHLKPLHIPFPPTLERWLGYACAVLFSPIWAPILATMMAEEWLKSRVSREWHPYFAWWPTRCDGWPNGFTGTVWLERVWRRRTPGRGIEFHRDQPSACEAAGSEGEAEAPGRTPNKEDR